MRDLAKENWVHRNVCYAVKDGKPICTIQCGFYWHGEGNYEPKMSMCEKAENAWRSFNTGAKNGK